MFGYLRNTLASPSNSCLLYTEPLGLQGEENINNRDLSVIAASSCCGVILYLFSIEVDTSFTTPSPSFTISEYVTQYGVGIITSSPLLTVANTTLARLCLAPVEAIIFSGLY